MSTAQAKTPAKKKQAPVKTTSKVSKKTQTKTIATPETEVKAPAAASKSAASKSAAKKAPAKAPAAEVTPAKNVAKSPSKPDAKPRRVKKESAKKESAKKEKVVRDSFTMPRSDYAKIAALKQKCLNNGVRVKKSELLRAALTLLDAAPDKHLVDAIKALETVKTGRPANA
ncbi:hypothetical protein [Caballeronia insecticola]|uniref:Uncharacterized protein n=1 Tax=Caballeronia insecticola TaxID=758793 RepID=R4WPM5_9BURK|nr:hypothetical protein [Caballeronia insecticola]BAN22815.1 putative uncharacterized protein [Caballeronia insecticola]